MLLSEERKLILDFDGPVPSPIHYRKHFTAFIYFYFSISSDYIVVVVVGSGGGGGVVFFFLSFSIIRCAFCECTSALQIIVDVPYCDKKSAFGTKKLIIIVVTKKRTT